MNEQVEWIQQVLEFLKTLLPAGFFAAVGGLCKYLHDVKYGKTSVSMGKFFPQHRGCRADRNYHGRIITRHSANEGWAYSSIRSLFSSGYQGSGR